VPDIGQALQARFTGFTGFLRANGFGVGCTEASDVIETVQRIGLFDPSLMRWSLKALLCGRGEEWRRFDELFDAYFLPPNRKALVESQSSGAGRIEQGGGQGLHDASEGTPLGPAGEGASVDGDGSTAKHGASGEESLTTADFRHLNRPEDVRAIEDLMRRFVRRLKHLQLRRERTASRGRRIHLGRTLRASVETGGLPLNLAWRAHTRVRPRLVLLLDVSRSMSLYSFFNLRLARALSGLLSDVHCFIYHTRLSGVSEALRDPDPWRSQERLQMLSQGWAGGTRIGECLGEFNRSYAPRLVHSRTAVVIVSDGYDTGEPELLTQGLAQLKRRARRLVWMNPLASRPGFEPVSRGMRAAAPYLDALVPGADLAALERALPMILGSLR
jgi:uncharacterized protein with von Willebrand factor type A (vWA) domain